MQTQTMNSQVPPYKSGVAMGFKRNNILNMAIQMHLDHIHSELIKSEGFESLSNSISSFDFVNNYCEGDNNRKNLVHSQNN